MYLSISTRLRILNSCRRTLSDNKVHDTTLFRTYTCMYKITNVLVHVHLILIHKCTCTCKFAFVIVSSINNTTCTCISYSDVHVHLIIRVGLISIILTHMYLWWVHWRLLWRSPIIETYHQLHVYVHTTCTCIYICICTCTEYPLIQST